MTAVLLRRMPLLLLAAVLACGMAACGDDDDSGGDADADTDTDTDADTDTDTDTDTDSDECTAPFEWGSGFNQDQVVSNWSFTGYIDGDGDGVVEEEEVEFNLEDIHCTGKQSLILAVSDVS